MSNDFERKLMDDVKAHGWHCVQVQGDAKNPPYSHTVGFHKTWKHPELLVMGLPPEVAHQILGMASELVAKGHIFKADQYDNSLLEDKRCLLRSIPATAHRKYMGLGVWFYRDTPGGFPALQLQWPDDKGRFPGEPGFEDGAMQPPL